MSLTIDTKRVLNAILSRPDVFSSVKESEVNEVARKMLLKQIKDKSMSNEKLNRIISIVGEDSIRTLLDEFERKDLSALIKKVDEHSQHVKGSAPENELRDHLISLGLGRVSITAKPVKTASIKVPKTSKQPSLPKSGPILKSKVHSGTNRTGGKTKN